MTSNSILKEIGYILERLPQRATSLYGTALTLPIVKWCHFRRDIAFCGISCNCIKFSKSLLHHATHFNFARLRGASIGSTDSLVYIDIMSAI